MGTLGIALGLDAPRFGSKSPAGGYLFPDDLMGIFISRGPPLGTEHLFRPWVVGQRVTFTPAGESSGPFQLATNVTVLLHRLLPRASQQPRASLEVVSSVREAEHPGKPAPGGEAAEQ